jgi:uncharacterized membrane protein YcaP (DUF421 family)
MWTIVWSSILLASAGTLVLRIAGRKSISQMTFPQVMILLVIGTVVGTEVSGKGMANTIAAICAFILFLMALEWAALRSNRWETLIKGKAVPVIQEGKLLVPNLRRLRMTVDDLEKRLRMAGISRIEDVKSGTIENNGELGYELFPEARPVTIRDLELILNRYFPQVHKQASAASANIFSEVHADSHHTEVPRNLQ